MYGTGCKPFLNYLSFTALTVDSGSYLPYEITAKPYQYLELSWLAFCNELPSVLHDRLICETLFKNAHGLPGGKKLHGTQPYSHLHEHWDYTFIVLCPHF